jgi:predicted O-linked N-acetylglucosamine transferase (SPINDLY family)
MSDSLFLDALQKITAGRFTLGELIETATTLNAASQRDLSRQLYKLWLRFNPEDPQRPVAQFNCAVLESDAGDLAGAADLLKTAIEANPDLLPAYINLGNVLERGGAAAQAIETWKGLLARVPQITGMSLEMKLTALKQVARVFSDHHEPALAEVAMREALEIIPEQREVIEQYLAVRMIQCEWPIMATSERVTRRTLMRGISPLSAAAFADDPILHLATSARYVEQAVPDPDMAPSDRRNAAIDLKERRLRVGYVSSDLRDHAIGYLMVELFELHDRNEVEVFAYYCGRPDEGALKSRIRGVVEHWVDIREISDDAAAERIAADGIDILVDVNGHTREARSGVFARRPAPILVNWLGYPGSMGTPYHHYIIADDWIIPPGSERYYSEKVLRLPCYQPNDRKRVIAPERPSRADVGLPEDAFVFCSFNGVQKLTRHGYERWLQILKATPGSVLWLLDPGEASVRRLGDVAEQHGVDRSRLIIAPKAANPFHLARYPLADLFLDSFPYGAHTTGSDALWMGVPVLTMSGGSFASRVCGSLVRAAGLPELVCDTPQAYVDRAIELANAPASVAAMKAKLEMARATCDLFNMEKLTASLEGLYRQMVAEQARGEKPVPDLSNLDVYLHVAAEFDHDGEELVAGPEYEAGYLARLARRHRARPIRPDERIWTEHERAMSDGESAGSGPAQSPRVRAAGGAR